MPGRDDFAGAWRIDRRIDDRLAGQAGHFGGTAVLTPDGPDGLDYSEEGTLRLGGGTPLFASRRFLWRFAKGQVDVRFADGAPFHAFTPEGQGAGTDHPCGADFYRVAYDFSRWPVWSAVWTVTGPRKDYVSASTYSR